MSGNRVTHSTIARGVRKSEFCRFSPVLAGRTLDLFFLAPPMRLSKKTEYALRALFAIARAFPNDKAAQRIEQLSKQENIPVKFLEQILLTLRHAGLLSSKRGVGGGYRLARPPAEITVGEVIRTLDGPLTPLPCAVNVQETDAERQAGAVPRRRDPRCTCPDERTCPVRVLMVAVAGAAYRAVGWPFAGGHPARSAVHGRLVEFRDLREGRLPSGGETGGLSIVFNVVGAPAAQRHPKQGRDGSPSRSLIVCRWVGCRS